VKQGELSWQSGPYLAGAGILGESATRVYSQGASHQTKHNKDMGYRQKAIQNGKLIANNYYCWL